MKRATAPKQETVLIFSTKAGSDFDGRPSLEIKVYPCRVEPGRKVRNYRHGSGDAFNGRLYLADLEILTWCHTMGGERQEPYRAEWTYSNATVDRASTARAMAATFDAIEKHCEALSTKLGHPTTFGASIGRLASAIGARSILYVREDRRGGWSHDETEYVWLDVGSGVGHIDSVIRQWIMAGKPAAVTP